MFRTLHKSRKSIASWWLAAERRKGELFIALVFLALTDMFECRRTL
jgi:hypothetical protein